MTRSCRCSGFAMTPFVTIRPVDPASRAWGRSLLAAIALHLALAAGLLWWVGLGLPVTGSMHLDPVAQATFTPDEPRGAVLGPQPGAGRAGLEPNGHTPPTERPEDADVESRLVSVAAAEPDGEMIRSLLENITEAASQPADPQARDELLRKAAVLQQISSPEEVDRMAAAIREAFGIKPFPMAPVPAGPGRAIDLDRFVLSDVSREEDGSTIRIREILVDATGTELILETSRTSKPGTSEVTYEQRLHEPGTPAVAVSASQEEFDAALARYQPFEIINRFPLVKQLHRQAVVPLMGKLAAKEMPTTRPHEASSQPTAP